MSPAPAMIEDSLQNNLYEKGVKNMCDNGIQHVPQKYVLPASERPNNINVVSDGDDDEAASTTPNTTTIHHHLNLPIIDFAQLQGPNRSDVLPSLSHACQNYGFFQLVNHGISWEVIESMENVSKKFFEMPLWEREKYMPADINSPVRYGTSFNQACDAVFCWRDFLKLTCQPLPQVLSHWPSSPQDFRQLAACYAQQTKALFMMVAEVILESLGLSNTKQKAHDDNINNNETILDQLRNGSQLMVINYYPACPQPDLTLGIPPHSDYGFLTFLLQDDVQGLQLLQNHRWLLVRPVPGSFVVNVGDHLEILSNGRYKSVLHRVIVNSMKCRISVASLHSFPFTSTVRPAEELITQTNPMQYKDTDFSNFLDYIKSCDSKYKNFLHSRKLNSITNTPREMK